MANSELDAMDIRDAHDARRRPVEGGEVEALRERIEHLNVRLTEMRCMEEEAERAGDLAKTYRLVILIWSA
jgi:hypothetical protein